jgi:hypothetical protein
VTTRADTAAATLARLGIDHRAGLTAAGIAPHLAGTHAAEIAAALGDLGTPEVAAVLVAVEPDIRDRAVRKEIRRALYRLRQRGVSIPAPSATPAPPTAATAAETDGLVSGFDARGDRVLWIVRSLATGGSFVVAATANEPGGLRDVHVAETSRKQLREVRRRMEAEAHVRLVAVDWRTCDALLVEAHERAGATERERDYLRVRPRLTTDPPRPPDEPVSARIAPPTADEEVALVAGSATLLEEAELRSWYPTPEASAPYVEEIRAIRASPLVLSRAAGEDRVREVLRRAAETLFPPTVLARRLGGTAYVLAETGRPAAARQALAVAHRLVARPADALELPFVAALVERGIGILLAETTAREEEARRTSLVMTPDQALRDRTSSRPGRTRA